MNQNFYYDKICCKNMALSHKPQGLFPKFILINSQNKTCQMQKCYNLS